MTSHTMLIVDDDPAVREVLELVFQGRVKKIFSVGCGLAALEAARTHKPDIIILDCMLPDMNGRDVCAQLHEQDSTRHIPILMLSGLGEIGPELADFIRGADRYLPKPPDLNELATCVNALLARRRPTPTCPPQPGIDIPPTKLAYDSVVALD